MTQRPCVKTPRAVLDLQSKAVYRGIDQLGEYLRGQHVSVGLVGAMQGLPDALLQDDILQRVVNLAGTRVPSHPIPRMAE